jgi:hypothetical protein
LSVGVASAAAAGSFLVSNRSAAISESISKTANLGEVSERIEKSEESLSSSIDRQLQPLKAERETIEQESRERKRKREQGEPKREQVIFAVMNRAGLGHRFIELAAGEDITYWRTGIFLLHGFLTDQPNRDRYVSAMEALVQIPEANPSSKGFNLYILGKMEQSRGNS